ncbi:hypothetical protein [Streptomyces sp. NPDC052225]|uniref:hypothetical protein n=1 Tax=Streptomyces sp. NPDC052225 TaxID=3154949 RepID=UPI00342B4D95
MSAVPSAVSRVRRVAVAGAAPGQPADWTLLDFEADARDGDALAAALAGCLSPEGGWYADLHSADEVYVVLAGQVHRYRRGDANGREAVRAQARARGVPEAQLDWAE